MTTPKQRKPAGPKPTIKARRLINLSMGAEHVEKAREIGSGNISRGVRMAVENYKIKEA